MTPTKKKPKAARRPDASTKKNAEMWHLLAVMHGYNELARKAETLGEKLYFRIGCDNFQKKYEAMGGKLERTNDAGPEVVVLTKRPPYIILHERDIELMRAAVRAFYAEQAEITEPKRGRK